MNVRDNLFAQVLIALALGVAVGLFFGESVAPLEVVAEIYVRLLQMAALPYVIVALIHAIGRLDLAWAKRIGKYGVSTMMFLWVVSLLTVVAVPIAYPSWESASFYSASTAPSPTHADLVKLYVPRNIFHSLSETIIPAVIVFCITFGIALMSVRGKHSVLDVFEATQKTLSKVAGYVVKLTPIGIFAIAGEAAGTLRLEELEKLQVFLYAFIAAWLVLGFWTFPMLVGVATPLSYRKVVKTARVAMITAFAAQTVLVVLPLIAEGCKQLLEEAELDSDETSATIDVLVPAAYTFPTAGTLLNLGFVLFTAWFVGIPLSVADYGGFVAVGAMSVFGGLTLAVPYMLDFFRLPADFFQLFLLAAITSDPFQTSLAAMHGFALCLIAACTVIGRVHWMRLVQVAAVGTVLSVAFLWVLGVTLTHAIPHAYTGGERLHSLKLRDDPAREREVEHPEALSAAALARDRLDVIRDRGSIRIGYPPQRLPLVYRNDDGELVGLDMELMHLLARDMDVTLELVPVDLDHYDQSLASGRIDLLVGGLAITPRRALKAAFTRPYITETMGFVVPDHRFHEFSDLEALAKLPRLNVAVPPARYYFEPVKRRLPNIDFHVVHEPEDYFKGELKDVDALLYSAEMGAAWTIIYPQYSVAVPDGLGTALPIAYQTPLASAELLNFMNTWIELKKDTGIVKRSYDYWVLGQDLERRTPRWSIMRNVLGWDK